MNKSQLEFSVSVYGKLEPVNDVLSKARVRIFYKYENRNGTYITDGCAEDLIKSLAGVPVKVIDIDDDNTSHDNNRGDVWGFVPETNNFAWEAHVDKDGVERTYACCDIYLFTALFPDAEKIIGKSQSMELYEPTLVYHFEIIGGVKYAVLDHASFLGLQVLGDKVEPCFEGASFYALQQSIQDTIQKIKEYSKGGTPIMNLNFRLSHSEIYDLLWAALNTDYCEAGNWIIDYSLLEVYDTEAIVYQYETGAYLRVSYTKDDENNNVVLGDKVTVFPLYATAEEKAVIEELRKLNGDSYELVNENLTHAEENAALISEKDAKIDELSSSISTLTTEADEAKAALADCSTKYADAEATIAHLTEDITNLENYKTSIENQHKEAVINEYAGKLSDDVIENYRNNLAQYSIEDLDMHLAYEWKKVDKSFSPEPQQGFIFKNSTPRNGVDEILSRYKK